MNLSVHVNCSLLGYYLARSPQVYSFRFKFMQLEISHVLLHTIHISLLVHNVRGKECCVWFCREWGCSTIVLASKRSCIHRLTVHFKCPTAWKWSTNLTDIESCSYAGLFIADQRRTRECDEMTPVNACVNKSLFQTHMHLQSWVSTRAKLGYTAFDAQLRKRIVTTLYVIRSSVRA